MGKKCIKCSYERIESDTVSELECPNCGVIYAKVEAIKRGMNSSHNQNKTTSKPRQTNKTRPIKSEDKKLSYPRVKANIGTADIFGHLFFWIILILFTAGIALFFLPYSFSKFILNRIEIIDKDGRKQKLQCDINIFGNIGHILLWMIISIFTLGAGYFSTHTRFGIIR